MTNLLPLSPISITIFYNHWHLILSKALSVSMTVLFVKRSTEQHTQWASLVPYWLIICMLAPLMTVWHYLCCSKNSTFSIKPMPDPLQLSTMVITLFDNYWHKNFSTDQGDDLCLHSHSLLQFPRKKAEKGMFSSRRGYTIPNLEWGTMSKKMKISFRHNVCLSWLIFDFALIVRRWQWRRLRRQGQQWWWLQRQQG